MLRKTTSFILLYSFIIMVLSGAMLFISPFGRLSMMIQWEMFGLNKMDYQALHLIFMLIFVLAGIVHIYVNYKSIMNYWKSKSKNLVFFTKEFSIATGIVSILFYLTVSHNDTTEKFVKMNKSFNDYWVANFKQEQFEKKMEIMRSRGMIE